MRIDTIKIDDFCGARAVDIATEQPTLLIAGLNKSGKSSIADAIRYALVDVPGREKLKKRYPALVSDGATDGSIELSVDGRSITVDVASGESRSGAGPALHDALGAVLDASRFSGLDPKDRRRVLSAATGVATDPASIRKALMATPGVSTEKVHALTKSWISFDTASKRAAGEAREAKGEWRGITGEQWGSAKGADWVAEPPPGTRWSEKDLSAAEGRAIAARNASDEMHTAEGRIEALAVLRREAEPLPQLEKEVADAISTHSAAEKELARLRTLYHEVVNGHPTFTCPQCGFVTTIDPAKYGPAPDPDPLESPDLPPSQSERSAASHRETSARYDLGQVRARLARAQAAQLALEDMGTSTTKMPGDPETIRKELLDADVMLERVRQNRTDCAEAEKDTKRAAQVHVEIAEWAELARRLSPDGIPAELLNETLGPVSARLFSTAKLAWWDLVTIDSGMDIWLGKRHYKLLSESEQWCADAMIADAISDVSGIGMVMLDRMDVLDPAARAKFMTWAKTRADEGKQTIVMATLKAPPAVEITPKTVDVVWMASGVSEAVVT